MPARRRSDQPTLPGMPTTAELNDTLWKAADKLRGSMDASQYKDFVLGLVFLKYVSDAFDERREQIRAELNADGMDEDQIAQLPRRRRRVHRRRRLLGARGRPLGVPGRAGQGRRRGDRRADRRRDGRDHEGANPSLDRRPAEDLQPGQRRPAPPRRAASTCSTTPGSPARARARPATCSARSTSTSWRSSPGPRASAAASSTPRPASSGCSSRCSSRTRAGSTTRAAGRAACSSRPRSSSCAHRGAPRRHRRLRPGAQRAHLAAGQDEPRHPRHQRRPVAPAGKTPSTPTSTPTSRPTSSWPTRRSTCPTGRGTTDDPRWRYGVPPAATRTSPGSSTSSTSSAPAARPAWSWPTARCPPSSPARARSAPRSSRRTWSPA